MTRVKRSVHARKKRRATLELAKGYRGDASRHYRVAKEAVLKADQYRYRDRRNRKRDFRRLWITRINAAARQNEHVLLAVHARSPARRRRARPQDPRGHRRPRRRHLPTLCRPRPRGAGGRLSDKPTNQHRHPGAAPSGGRLFCSPPHDDHKPPQPEAQGDPQAPPAAALARALGPVRGRGRGPAGGGGRGRLDRGRALLRGGQRPARDRGRAGAAGVRLRARVGDADAGRVRGALGAARRSGRCACTCTASRTRATSARCCAAPRRSAPRGWRSARGRADPFSPKAVRASMGAVFAVPLARDADVGDAPGRQDRPRARARACRSHELWRSARVYVKSSANSARRRS